MSSEACALCRGACCEVFALNPVAWGWPADVCRWMEYHGKPTPLGVEYPLPCIKLVDGRCSIYEDRPEMCRAFEPGCEACRHCVTTRRPARWREILALMG